MRYEDDVTHLGMELHQLAFLIELLGRFSGASPCFLVSIYLSIYSAVSLSICAYLFAHQVLRT